MSQNLGTPITPPAPPPAGAIDEESARLYKAWLAMTIQDMQQNRKAVAEAAEAAKEKAEQEKIKQAQIREDNQKAIAKREADMASCNHKRPDNTSVIGGWVTNPYTQEMILCCRCGKHWQGRKQDLKRELEGQGLWPDERELGAVMAVQQ